MKTGDVIALLAALLLIAGIYFAKDIIPYIDKVWNAPKDCPSCPECTKCEACKPCDVKASTGGFVPFQRIYLPQKATEYIVKYKSDTRTKRGEDEELAEHVKTRRAIFDSIAKEDREAFNRFSNYCETYQMYLGMDKPYIEFANCDESGPMKKIEPTD